MNMLQEIYVQETLDRVGQGRHRRTRAPGDEGPRRSLARAAACLVGRALVGLGARLLAFGGERARAAHPALIPHTPPQTYFHN